MRSKAARRAHDRMPQLAVRGRVGRLSIVLGDQLNPHAEAITHLDKSRDAILMMEVSEESTYVPSHKQRTVLFLSAMRHFARDLARRGYGHHIQRLMVTGNFALIAGVDPRLISDWYLAMYVDAVDWATLPNTLGMVMHADGGVVGTNPYAASGKYIERMSNYCCNCSFDPAKRVGATACPFSTIYWDFLIRNRRRFRSNRRMSMMLRNVDRLTDEERAAVSAWGNRRRREFGIPGNESLTRSRT